MTTIFLVLTSVFVFFVGLFSPKTANQIKRKSNLTAIRLNKSSKRLWNPAMWLAQSAIRFINKVINFSARLGQKSRWKILQKLK